MEHETGPQPSLEGKAKDEDRLAELGYKQELTRNWSLLHNFGVSFSIIVRRVVISSFLMKYTSYCTVILSKSPRDD